MSSPGTSLADLRYHAARLQDILLPGIWPAQGNMGSLWAVLLITSFLWIIYRLVSVFHKPAAEIEELLGQDIPPVPEVALSSVGPDSVVLYWKLPDNYHTPVKNCVHVNGISVVENDGSSPTVTVSRLQPGRRYTIRAVSSNSAGFSSFSQPIHLQTVPQEGQRAARLLAATDPGSSKRPSTGGRRISAVPVLDDNNESPKAAQDAHINGSDSEHTVAKLQKRLDLLRSEDEDLQGELEEEVAENDKARSALAEERDKLKKQHDDKEKAWNESRKHLVDLEKASKAAQRKKSKKESEVQQKKKKRQQMMEEMGGWAEKEGLMRHETEKLRRDLQAVREKHAGRLEDAKKAIEDAQARGKSLEEEIREWGIRIKAIEEEKRLADEREEEEEQEADRQEKEVETRYQVQLQDLEVRYQELYGLNMHVHAKLQNLLQLRAGNPQAFATLPANEASFSPYVQQPRSTRGSISRASTLPYQQQSSYNNAPNSSFAPFNTSSPALATAFPAQNAMDSLAVNSDRDRLSLTTNELEALTGGAQMSPSADGLLPSNLLSDDPNSTLRPRMRPSVLGGIFSPEHRASDPQSPSSQHSGSHNFFPSSPPASSGLDVRTGMPVPDIDRALDNLNEAAPRRTLGLFNFGSRRNTKGSLRDPPALGTLRQGEKQSFNDDFEDAGVRHSGHQKTISNPWMNMGGLLSRGGASTTDDVVLGSDKPTPRKSRRLLGSGKFDEADPFYGLERPTSSRPASVYSYDQQLLRPSSENHPFPFGAGDHLRIRNSPIGGDWSSLGGGAYSNNHSRRQSIQHHGSTSNLSLGSTPLDLDEPGLPKPAPVAPIGAGRPGKSRKQKLNPGAPSFISTVFSRSESRRTPKSDKGAFDSLFDAGGRSNSLRHEADPGTPGLGGLDDSPPVSRLSRDGSHSVMTSTTDSHDSMGGDSDVAAGGNNGSVTTTGTSSTSAAKEGFMSRLTRKGSSTKFWGGSGGGDSGSAKKKGHSHAGSISGSIVSRRKSADLPVTPSEADENDLGGGGGGGSGGGVGDYLGLHKIVTGGHDSTGSAAGTPTDGTPSSSSAAKRAGLSWGKMMGKKSRASRERADGTGSTAALSETSESRDEDE